MPKEKVPIAKASSSSTTEGSKERSCEPNGEEEKIVLQDLVRNLERILNEQNKYITTLRVAHNGQSLKQRWIPGNGDAWGGQTTDMENGSTDTNISQDNL